LEALVGEIPIADELAQVEVRRQDDGSWLIDGMLPIEELKSVIELPNLPAEERGVYETLGGFVMTHQGRIPRVGDRFTWGGYRFEVLAMDGLRVDRVRLTPQRPSTDPSA
jgi:putative hemolysin